MNTRYNLSMAILLGLSLAFQSCCLFKGGSGGNVTIDKIDVNAAFNKVYLATQQALVMADAAQDFTVESIDLSFATTSTFSADVGVKLWVLSGKYSRSWSTTSTSTYSFSQDLNTKKALSLDKKIETFVNQVTASLLAAKDVKKIGSFGLNELEIEVNFSIKKSGEGGVEIELSPITPSANASKEKEIAHSITIKLKKK